MFQQIQQILDKLRADSAAKNDYKKGLMLYEAGEVQILSQGKNYFEILVADYVDEYKVSFEFEEKIAGECSCKADNWCYHRIAGILQAQNSLNIQTLKTLGEGKLYTRQGMVKRVLEERKLRATKAKYKIVYADNIYGEHILLNEKGVRYKITIRNFKQKIAYCSCNDYATNKLGTCKHLMFVFDSFKGNFAKKKDKQPFPFVEVYLDPLNEYKIAWFYPDEMPEDAKFIILKHFKKSSYIEPKQETNLLSFLKEASDCKHIYIRQEVFDKIEKAFDKKLLEQKAQETALDFSVVKAELFPYQKEGIAFATFRKGAIIADEMGLGKTIQAISAAIFKKQLLGFEKTLVICPASLKAQWKSEIEKFTNESAEIIEGTPQERSERYLQSNAYFLIINYETVLRDKLYINSAGFDFIILDEAQKIKNYETITSNAIKSLKRNHSLVITGTPIENKLVDIYSIAGFAEPELLSPLWEFSYQHCYFDKTSANKITGYFNLQNLKDKLKSILIRREKKDVIKQLNNITSLDVSIEMHPEQQDYHASYAKAIASILRKKFRTPYDMNMLTMNLQNMRMVCDSTFLVDKKTHYSPKLIELEEIILQKLALNDNDRKVIIFSEWTTMLLIIGKMLSEKNIGFTELTGKVPVKKRKELIKEFETNPKCQVFLSTEAGGAGLNLQVADTVINFELPWNPSKKNQRIGRIDRLGQRNKNLTVINLITRNSIEMKIATGLMVKQNLFDSVLNEDNKTDDVDFSEKGRAQFLKELEAAMEGFLNPSNNEEKIVNEEENNLKKQDSVLQLDIFEEEQEEERLASEKIRTEQIKKMDELETVMNKGMDFLAGLFKMSTGKDLHSEANKVEINKETGEIIMRFKVEI